MTDKTSNRMDFETTRIDPASDVFAKVCPHLVPGALRRQLSVAEIQKRAWLEIWNLARRVLRRYDAYDEILADEMANTFINRVFAGDAMTNYDAKRGEIGNFLYGIMRYIACECFRKRSRQRIEIYGDPSCPQSGEPQPSAISERNDEVQRVRSWAMELPPAQRNAVARHYEALADLDNGGFIPNQAVNLHRGKRRLRERARESDRSDRAE
jgi:DNA-directed RNA polymerase specialized sigma24 family protein